MRNLLIILLEVLLAASVLGAYCNGKPDQYYVNNQPIWEGKSTFVKKHAYG